MRRAVSSALRRAGLAAALALAACSTTSKPTPAPLEPLAEARLAARPLWSSKLEAVSFPLTVAVRDGAFTLAGSDGRVVALAADDGHELWRTEINARLAAGVGSDGRYAAVVTRDNELHVLDAGKPLWHTALASRVETPPTVIVPANSAGTACGTSPLKLSANVDLPHPLGPRMRSTSPGATSTSTSSGVQAVAPG